MLPKTCSNANNRSEQQCHGWHKKLSAARKDARKAPITRKAPRKAATRAPVV